jgi:hypothetical protein
MGLLSKGGDGFRFGYGAVKMHYALGDFSLARFSFRPQSSIDLASTFPIPKSQPHT